jgi:Nucleotide-diphospho-sugar transferase
MSCSACQIGPSVAYWFQRWFPAPQRPHCAKNLQAWLTLLANLLVTVRALSPQVMLDFGLNWYAHLQNLGATNMWIASYERETADFLVSRGMPCFDVTDLMDIVPEGLACCAGCPNNLGGLGCGSGSDQSVISAMPWTPPLLNMTILSLAAKQVPKHPIVHVDSNQAYLFVSVIATGCPCTACCGAEGFKWGERNWNKMVWSKVMISDIIIAFGFNLVLSDTDVVWFTDPTTLFDRYPQAEVMMGSDALSTPSAVGDQNLELPDRDLWSYGASFNTGGLGIWGCEGCLGWHSNTGGLGICCF